MKRLLPLFVALAALLGAPRAHAVSPFTVTPQLTTTADKTVVSVHFAVPPQHYLYADDIRLRWINADNLPAFQLPPSKTQQDRFSKTVKQVFDQSFEARCELPVSALPRLQLEIRYRGCDEANCYFPEKREFHFAENGSAIEVDQSGAILDGAKIESLAEQLAGFHIVARGSGYLGENQFLQFLASASAPGAAGVDVARMSLNWLLLIVLGGLALNLTPCVLPMIPINLAIIGAGAMAQTRARGLLLGAAYGGGIAIAYGLLGAIVVATGAKVGSLQASPWFNLAVALLFIVLSLVLLDRVNLSALGIQPRNLAFAKSKNGSFLLAFASGAFSAITAGACVAPVVISVLVQATTNFGAGHTAALLLPFLLGLGMGLPWPLVGAGLSILPAPGRWMNGVKYAFALGVFALALLYGATAFVGFQQTFAKATDETRLLADRLTEALHAARAENKPVFLDFWASWCKICLVMEHTTFKSTLVQSRLGGYVQARLQVEEPNAPAVKKILDRLGVVGLPSYLVLIPDSAGASSAPPDSAQTADPPPRRWGWFKKFLSLQVDEKAAQGNSRS